MLFLESLRATETLAANVLWAIHSQSPHFHINHLLTFTDLPSYKEIKEFSELYPTPQSFTTQDPLTCSCNNITKAADSWYQLMYV